jgi:DNA replication and repair protein RecF
MIVENICVSGFRNIARTEVEFSNRFNIFFGANGQGKTNFLEALFFLGTLKSFRHAKQADVIAWDSQSALLKTVLVKERIRHNLAISFEAHTKQLFLDSKPVTRMAEFCSALSVVAFSPEELLMVTGTPEQRRRYLDRAVFSSNPGYLKLYHDYYRVLKNRNHLLKQRTYAGLEAWTEQLISFGIKLIMARKNYVAELADHFRVYYGKISGSDEHGELCYHTKSLSPADEPAELAAIYRSCLAENLRLECERCMTLIGPHRDDLGFYLNSRPISQHGSQGQQKSFVLALKMAEIDYLKKTTGVMPVLLLDDMTAELDRNRIKHLLDFLLEREMQVFITTTDPADASLPESALCSSFLVENGRIVQ